MLGLPIRPKEPYNTHLITTVGHNRHSQCTTCLRGNAVISIVHERHTICPNGRLGCLQRGVVDLSYQPIASSLCVACYSTQNILTCLAEDVYVSLAAFRKVLVKAELHRPTPPRIPPRNTVLVVGLRRSKGTNREAGYTARSLASVPNSTSH